MTDVLRRVEVGASQRFVADHALGEVWESVVADGSPLFAVDGPRGELRGLADLAVRRAVQDRVDPRTPLWALASAADVAADEAAAHARLTAEPGRAAVLFRDGAGTPQRVERTPPPPRTAVVMAGGFGTRLRPLTDDTPKPLLDIGGRPLLRRILDQLHDAGVRRVHVSVHYLAERVEEALAGDDTGLELDFLHEDEPLDTGAGLALLERVDGPFVLINGDILTNLDLRAMARHHLLAGNAVTVATWLHTAPLAYGVVRHDDAGRVDHIEEKPVYRYPINAGVYVFAPRVLERVTPRRPLAMVDFLNRLARADRVGCFPLVEYWNDVGSHADYARAQREVHGL